MRDMTERFQIVVSAENNPYNNPYSAWQAKLFYFSCMTRLNQKPLIVVHDTDRDWPPDFVDIVKAGGLLKPAPNYRVTKHGDWYVPRNTAGTLLEVAAAYHGQCEYFVLCDPDLIFVRPVKFPEGLSGDYCSYLDYDQRNVEKAMQTMGLRPDLISGREELRCGVPHVIPTTIARQLAETWLEAIDAFPPRDWLDGMYAFGLAVVKLNLSVATSLLAVTDLYPNAPATANLIHYCDGNRQWNKRSYVNEDGANSVWDPPINSNRGTVLGQIISQIREANEFYRDYRWF
jgi:hypothetical protein